MIFYYIKHSNIKFNINRRNWFPWIQKIIYSRAWKQVTAETETIQNCFYHSGHSSSVTDVISSVAFNHFCSNWGFRR